MDIRLYSQKIYMKDTFFARMVQDFRHVILSAGPILWSASAENFVYRNRYGIMSSSRRKTFFAK